jgi:3-oxoadipate enol-lactonase
VAAVLVTVNDIEVLCDIDGDPDAPALLCLHSLATDHQVWDAQTPHLAPHFRVVRPDLRGHGGTSSTPPPYDLDRLRLDAVGLLDALELNRVAVMGVSIGAIIAIGLALDSPGRVERIVVADCRADAPPPYVAMWDGAIATVMSEGLDPVLDASIERWFSADFRSARPDVVSAVRDRARHTSVDGFIGCARAVQGLAYLPRLAEIDVPALFVVGGQDPAAPPDVMRAMADRVPGSGFVELAGAGHLTPIEAAEEFTAAVVPFLVGS